MRDSGKKGSYLVSLVAALVCFGIDGVVLYDFSHINGIYAGNMPEIDFSFIGDILQGHDITVSEEVSQKSYFVWERDFNTVDTREYWRDLPRLAMRISEYNAMRKMAGFEPLILVCYYGATIYMIKRNINRTLNSIR